MSVYTGLDSPTITFLDPRRLVTLKYAQYTSLTVAAGVASVQTYNLNSLFDPDRTGSGTQPYGYDTLASIYNRYRVLSTRWKVTFLPTTGSYIGYVLPVNGLVNTAPTTVQTFTDNVMNPRCKSYTIGLNADPAICFGKIALNDLNGVSITEYLADDRFEASVSSSPTEIITLSIGVVNQTAGSLGLNFFTEIWYHADMHDVIPLGPS